MYYFLYKIAVTQYNLHVSTSKLKVMELRGKTFVRANIVVSPSILFQIFDTWVAISLTILTLVLNKSLTGIKQLVEPLDERLVGNG